MCTPGRLYHSEAPSGGETAVARFAVALDRRETHKRRATHGLALGLPLSFERLPVSYAISLFVGPTMVARSQMARLCPSKHLHGSRNHQTALFCEG